MADAAMYFIRHDEAQLHSTRGALGQTGLKSPRHYLSCLLRAGGRAGENSDAGRGLLVAARFDEYAVRVDEWPQKSDTARLREAHFWIHVLEGLGR